MSLTYDGKKPRLTTIDCDAVELRNDAVELHGENRWLNRMVDRLRRKNDMLSEQNRESYRVIAEQRAKLAAQEQRLMPSGMSWPRFEDGEPVRFGDEYVSDAEGTCRCQKIAFNETGFWLTNSAGFVAGYWLYGERVKRPPKDTRERFEHDLLIELSDKSGYSEDVREKAVAAYVDRAKALAESDAHCEPCPAYISPDGMW